MLADFRMTELAIVSEEADESELWLRIIRRTDLQNSAIVAPLEQEAHELARSSRRPFELPVASVSAWLPPRLRILHSTIFNLTTIRKSNNLQVFQFCEVAPRQGNPPESDLV